MKVELVEWPSEEERLSQLRREHVPRLVLVPEGMAPPLTADVLEDWIRLPAVDEDIRSRVRVLADRADGVDLDHLWRHVGRHRADPGQHLHAQDPVGLVLGQEPLP